MVPTPPSPQPSHQTVQPNARDHGQFAVPSLAQSISPQYPRLPHPNNSPYGPNPHQNPIDVPGHPVSPPIRPGSLASPPVVTVPPTVTATSQPVPAAMSTPST